MFADWIITLGDFDLIAGLSYDERDYAVILKCQLGLKDSNHQRGQVTGRALDLASSFLFLGL